MLLLVLLLPLLSLFLRPLLLLRYLLRLQLLLLLDRFDAFAVGQHASGAAGLVHASICRAAACYATGAAGWGRKLLRPFIGICHLPQHILASGVDLLVLHEWVAGLLLFSGETPRQFTARLYSMR